jgi:nitrite reductase/ring-hydroxylating ferredoxin subunit/uncharacterized membrane protein
MAESLIDRVLREQRWMDPFGDFVQRVVGGIYGALGPLGPALKNLAHGTWALRHPLHPALTDFPLGAWSVGVIADFAARYWHVLPTQAGDIGLAAGVVAALGAVLTGYTDFHETYALERRSALLHGLVMTTVFVLMALSLALRWWAGPGAHDLAVWIALAGVLLTMLGMYLGGHVVYRFGTAVDRNAFVEAPEDFVDVGALADFPEGRMKSVDAGAAKVLVVRRGDSVLAISNVCSHAGGPLDEGELQGDVVTCPWHGSKFCIRDGAVRGGPATFSQPRYEARVSDGRLELKLMEVAH